MHIQQMQDSLIFAAAVFWNILRSGPLSCRTRPSNSERFRIVRTVDIPTSSPEATAVAFPNHLAKMHTIHDGPKFCATTRSMVESKVKGNDTEKNYLMLKKNAESTGWPSPRWYHWNGWSGCDSGALQNQTFPGQDGITCGMLKRIPLWRLSSFLGPQRHPSAYKRTLNPLLLLFSSSWWLY